MKTSKAAKAPRPAPRGAGNECERNEAGASSEDYVIGQVVNSLFQNKFTTCRPHPLAHLFNASESETQPVFVAVPRANKKRKHTEVERATEDQSSSTKREPPIKLKKAKKNKLSIAEKRLANRECALEQADEKEEEKGIKVKQKLKNRASQAVTKSLASSANEIDVKQCKKKSQINEAEEMLKNQRTVFVGNLPISCTVQMLKSFFKEYGQIESIRFRSLVPAEDTLSKKLAAIKKKVLPLKLLKEMELRLPMDFTSELTLLQKPLLMTIRGLYLWEISHMNTDAVHLALKLNNSELKGRKLRVKRCVEKEKNKKSSDNVKNSGPKHRFGTSLKNTKKYTNNSFAGEKATPLKKKTKRPKSVTRTKGGKHK
ncbi:RNA-binding protein 34 isoform X1 [Malaclemys terrapin pileata]|uniref:RNA-binding protein 34 isoform X1 n=1 Tax=Malaclemys terrapin pileata TaxID=2991368 RepID=UPI0023A8194E|nr:RNA-binding protein 34 isoform X1 [Malaclemys terrapin pileata]